MQIGLSRPSQYALRALVHMLEADPADPADRQRFPAKVLGAAVGVNPMFLLKALKPLVAAHVVDAVTGPHGGYKLAVGIDAGLPIAEVTNALDGAPSARADGAPELRFVSENMAAAIKGVVDGTKLGDLLVKTRSARNIARRLASK